jgi:serine/threonine-protein kinase
MQWIDGGTLADVIAREAPLPASRAVTTAAKLASALAAAHGHNILHRDIKPGNILVDRNGEPYLADFGLARLIGETGVTRHGVFVGTPHYASPEQIALEELDERSDLYGLGLVIFEMVTGRRPFEAESLPEVLTMHRTAPPPDPRELVPGLPGELAVLLLRCLAKKPDDRLESAAELEGALRRIGEAL